MSETNTPADVRYRPVGMGTAQTFICPLCKLAKGTLGRKMKRVRGLRTWVCKGCAG